MTPHGDRPGLQAERTVLAWDRTALAVLANGALLLVRDVRGIGAAGLVAAGLALVAAVALVVLGRRRAGRLRGVTGLLPADPGALAAGGLVVAVELAVLAVLVAER